MAHTLILTLHIAAGALGIALGPFAIARVAVGRVTWLTSAYHLSVALVCLSAVGLAALDPARLWWFVLIATGSYFFAARAMRDIRSAQAHWQARAVRGFGGAYVALWTAVVVVSVPGQPLAWAIPTVIGIPALEWFAASIARRLPAQSARRLP